MAKKLKQELSSGALIIVNETHLPEWFSFEIHVVGILKLLVVVYTQV